MIACEPVKRTCIQRRFNVGMNTLIVRYPLSFRELLNLLRGLPACCATAFTILVLSCGTHGTARAQASQAQDDAPKASPATPESPAKPAKDKSLPQQTVEGKRPWDFNKKTRYQHSLPEVNGPTITVTKKTSVVDLDAQPAVI